MRYLLLAAMALTMLAGCADMTPERQANVSAAIQQVQSNLAAQSQAYANAAHQNAPVNCLTTYTQDAAYTSCH